MRILAGLLWAMMLLGGIAAASPAQSGALDQARAAFASGHYVHAMRLQVPLARRGSPRAQAMIGFMYEHGLGAPQAYDVAVDYYARAAERGDPSGQYLLGLMYDKGHGVDQD